MDKKVQSQQMQLEQVFSTLKNSLHYQANEESILLLTEFLLTFEFFQKVCEEHTEDCVRKLSQKLKFEFLAKDMEIEMGDQEEKLKLGIVLEGLVAIETINGLSINTADGNEKCNLLYKVKPSSKEDQSSSHQKKLENERNQSIKQIDQPKKVQQRIHPNQIFGQNFLAEGKSENLQRQSIKILSIQNSYICILEKQDYDQVLEQYSKKLIQNKIQLIQEIDFFASYDKKILTKISNCFEQILLQKNQYLFSQKQRAEYMYIIKEGCFEKSHKFNQIMLIQKKDSLVKGKQKNQENLISTNCANSIVGGHEAITKINYYTSCKCSSKQGRVIKINWEKLISKIPNLTAVQKIAGLCENIWENDLSLIQKSLQTELFKQNQTAQEQEIERQQTGKIRTNLDKEENIKRDYQLKQQVHTIDQNLVDQKFQQKREAFKQYLYMNKQFSSIKHSYENQLKIQHAVSEMNQKQSIQDYDLRGYEQKSMKSCLSSKKDSNSQKSSLSQSRRSSFLSKNPSSNKFITSEEIENESQKDTSKQSQRTQASNPEMCQRDFQFSTFQNLSETKKKQKEGEKTSKIGQFKQTLSSIQSLAQKNNFKGQQSEKQGKEEYFQKAQKVLPTCKSDFIIRTVDMVKKKNQKCEKQIDFGSTRQSLTIKEFRHYLEPNFGELQSRHQNNLKSDYSPDINKKQMKLPLLQIRSQDKTVGSKDKQEKKILQCSNNLRRSTEIFNSIQALKNSRSENKLNDYFQNHQDINVYSSFDFKKQLSPSNPSLFQRRTFQIHKFGSECNSPKQTEIEQQKVYKNVNKQQIKE